MKDTELVRLWGQNPEILFDTFAENQWQPIRWTSNWKRRGLLPKHIREFIQQEVNHVTDTRKKGGIPLSEK